MQEEKYLELLGKFLSNNLSVKESEDLTVWLDVNPELDCLKRDLEVCRNVEKPGFEQQVDTTLGWLGLQIAIGKSAKTSKSVAPNFILTLWHSITGLFRKFAGF